MLSPLPSTADVEVINVRAVGIGGEVIACPLSSGDALVIGCSPACGLRLEGPGIAGLHCTLSWDENGLTVEDWDTEIGTYVNGERVASRLVVECGSELKIGNYQVFTEIEREEPPPPEANAPTPPQPSSPPTGSLLQELLSAEADSSGKAALPNLDDGLLSDVPAPVAASPPTNVPATESVRPGVDTDAWDSPFDDISPTSGWGEPPHTGYVRDGLNDEEASTAQVEIEFLRRELADRDARLAELEELALVAGPPPDDDLPTREEVETLAERLETLLAELELSDERISTMSELLRLSDEANVASQEERAQMESWIGEVERRVRQWEEEWHAERESLEKTITEVTAQRDRAESQGGTPDQTTLVNELREHASTLQSQLQQLQAEKDDLHKRFESAQVASVEEQVAAAVEVTMREERLQLSQAKAEYARERAELTKQREAMMYQQSSTTEANVADERIRAFREHLKEVRATEPSSGRPAPSLSQRLGKLWRKIDGKPLDTD